MLYSKFLVSEVYLKNVTIIEVGLNYNFEMHQLIFIEDKQFKELAGLETIDGILVLGKSFDSEANKDKNVIIEIRQSHINEYQETDVIRLLDWLKKKTLKK
ncbi:MAG: hypothetical protein WCJ80_10385 [Bacteroidota bacterium]